MYDVYGIIVTLPPFTHRRIHAIFIQLDLNFDREEKNHTKDALPS